MVSTLEGRAREALFMPIEWHIDRFNSTHIARSYAISLEQRKVFTQEKVSTPTRFVWEINTVAVLFWDTNMAALTSLM